LKFINYPKITKLHHQNQLQKNLDYRVENCKFKLSAIVYVPKRPYMVHRTVDSVALRDIYGSFIAYRFNLVSFCQIVFLNHYINTICMVYSN